MSVDSPGLIFPETNEGNRIIAMGAPRPASQDPSGSHEKTIERSVQPQCIKGIFGTRRDMPA